MRIDQRGFTYLLLLFAVAALGIASAGTALMWSTLSQIERERELLFIGGEFSRALQSYYDATPEAPKRYPATLLELIEDKRQQVVQRHLRKIYFDPMTREQDWELVMVAGQIRAIHSKSEQVARITVLPRWVDATGDKLKLPRAGQKTPPLSEPVPVAAAGDLRHADWLFIPMPASDALTTPAGSAPGGAPGNVSGGGAADNQAAAIEGRDTRSLQEQYMSGDAGAR
jgi:type II secretory pathway pseudopilin PulG